jgi:hypothetical protein
MLEIYCETPPQPGDPLSVVQFDVVGRRRPFVYYIHTDKYQADDPDFDFDTIREQCYIDSPEAWSIEAVKFISETLYNAKMKLIDKDQCLLELALILLTKS